MFLESKDILRKLNDPVRVEIDFVYKLTKTKYKNIRFSCYGGRFYGLFSLYDEYLHFYLTDNSILYTASGTRITEIPIERILKISVRKSVLSKSMIHIRLIADKRYHFFIYCNEHFSTDLTGDEIKNANSFIDTLKASVGNNPKI